MSLSFPSRLLKSVPGPEESPPGLGVGASSWGSASVELVLPIVCPAPPQVQPPQSVQSERSLCPARVPAVHNQNTVRTLLHQAENPQRNIVLLCDIDVERRQRASSARLTRLYGKAARLTRTSRAYSVGAVFSGISSVKDGTICSSVPARNPGRLDAQKPTTASPQSHGRSYSCLLAADVCSAEGPMSAQSSLPATTVAQSSTRFICRADLLAGVCERDLGDRSSVVSCACEFATAWKGTRWHIDPLMP